MTPAQQAHLRRLAALCVRSHNYQPLVLWVDQYRVSPSPVTPSPTAADVWKPLGWWQRLLRIM